MGRRVQGEARTRKASRQPPPTVMDHVNAELLKQSVRYIEMRDNPDIPRERVHSQRGVIRGLAISYAMWYGSTPGQPKRELIRETEMRAVKDARAYLEKEDDDV